MSQRVRRCLFDRPYFEKQIETQLLERNLPPLKNSPPDGIYVLLRLKPPGWSLESFSRYINDLQDLRNSLETTDFDLLMSQIIDIKDVFFFMDNSLDRSDLVFLFRHIIEVPFTETSIPTDATGVSLVNGNLKVAFEDGCYTRVEKYIQGSRKAFQRHLQELRKILRPVESQFFSLFNTKRTLEDDKWSDYCSGCAYPEFKKESDRFDFSNRSSALAFEQPYLFGEIITKSFVGYIENIVRSDETKYFASYGFLGQSSCVGKTRLLSEYHETDTTALFIVNICCRAHGNQLGFPNPGEETMKIIDLILEARTEESMTGIIEPLLQLVIKNAFIEEVEGSDVRFLKDGLGLSNTLEGLHITEEELRRAKSSMTSSAVEELPYGLKRASRNLYVKRQLNGVTITKKVILLIAFDEAGRLIDNIFALKDDDQKKDSSSKSVIQSLTTMPVIQDASLNLESGVKPQESIENKVPLISFKKKLPETPTVKGKEKETLPTIMNTFRLIRRVLKTGKTYLWHIPFIFSGTNTRFSNFVPCHSKDPSVRSGFGANDEVPSGDGILLFDPYVLTLTFDLYALAMNYGPPMTSDWKEYMESCDYQYHISNLGRPFWGGILKGRLVRLIEDAFLGDVHPRNFIPSAQRKNFLEILLRIHNQALQKVQYDPNEKDALDRVESAASIAIMLSGSEWLYGAMANALVEKRMAVLLDYRYDTSQVRVAYPSEPVLALAALHQLHEHPISILDDLLLSNECLNGSSGDIGEFASRIILLLALDKITLMKPYCSVKTFFENLLGEDVKKLKGDRQTLSVLGGQLCFSHFARIPEHRPDPNENLRLLTLIHAALLTPKGYKGIDLILPVVLGDGSGGVGSIHVQVKSWAQKLYKGEIKVIIEKITKSRWTSVKNPTINLVMNLSPELEYSCEVWPRDPKKNNALTIIIQGLSDKFPLLHMFPGLEQKLRFMISIGRFEIDFRRNKVERPPVTLSLPRIFEAYSYEDKGKDKLEESQNSELPSRTKKMRL